MRHRLVWLGLLAFSPAWGTSVEPDAYCLTVSDAQGVMEEVTLKLADGELAKQTLWHPDPRTQEPRLALTVILSRDGSTINLEVIQKDDRGLNTVAPVDDTDGLGVDLPRSEQRSLRKTAVLKRQQTLSWSLPGSPNDAPRTVTLSRQRQA